MSTSKKWIWRIVDSAVPLEHRVKLEESENKDKYQDLAWELPKLWEMKLMMIPNVIGALGKVAKRYVQGMEDF